MLGRTCERVDVPVVVNADTGFGNALNVQRTVRVLECAGAAAIQLEDQAFPKRCCHLRDKGLIPAAEMAGKVRAEQYVEAGADILFVEAPGDREQLAAIGERFGDRLPLLANMVEGGRTPLAPAAELAGCWTSPG